MDDIDIELKSAKKSKEEILSILDDLETREKDYAISEIEIQGWDDEEEQQLRKVQNVQLIANLKAKWSDNEIEEEKRRQEKKNE